MIAPENPPLLVVEKNPERAVSSSTVEFPVVVKVIVPEPVIPVPL